MKRRGFLKTVVGILGVSVLGANETKSDNNTLYVNGRAYSYQ